MKRGNSLGEGVETTGYLQDLEHQQRLCRENLARLKNQPKLPPLQPPKQKGYTARALVAPMRTFFEPVRMTAAAPYPAKSVLDT